MTCGQLSCVLFLLVVACFTSTVCADEVDERIDVIAAVGRGGSGSPAARDAAQALSARGIEILPRMLQAMDTPNPVAANWYRTVYETIVRRELENTSPKFPIAELKAYTQKSERGGKPRRLVLRLLDRLEPNYRDEFIPTRLDDPEFRDDAVAHFLTAGDEAKKAEQAERATEMYRRAFRGARDPGQIQTAAAKLKSVGQPVSIIDHMGFVIDWYLLGPFDAPGKSGFDKSFPPEALVDLNASYEGQRGKMSWKRHQTTDAMGQLNLATAIAATSEAVGYAYTEIDSPTAQSVQLRCGADDNLTVWVNGEKVLARLQWLNGIRLDRFTAPVQLRRGKNRVLVKICQGPQHKNPAVPNNWSMQLRFCSNDGAAVGVHTSLPKLESRAEGEAEDKGR